MVDWLQISQVSGSSGTYTVTVTASSTSELTARTASLTVTAHAPAGGGIWTDKTETISIRQRGTGELVVTPTVLNFVASGGSATIEITTYLGDWTITGSDWLSFSQTTGGTGQTTVTVTAPDYSGDRRRIGSISITDGYSTVNVNVSQWGVFSVVPNSFTFPASGGTESFTVSASRNWSITNIPAWITMSQVSGYNGTFSITMTADTNTGAVRTGGFDVSDGYSTVNCDVSQDANVLIVTPMSFEFPWTGESKTMSITTCSNSWSITDYPEWLTVSQTTGGSGETEVTLTTRANVQNYREGTFIVNDGNETITGTVRQNRYIPNTYLTLEIVSAGTITCATNTLYSRINGGNWAIRSSFNQSVGDIIEFSGETFNRSGTYDPVFSGTAAYNVSGNLMSLTTASTLSAEYMFREAKVVSASDLVIQPELSSYCCNGMFWSCETLTAAPALPATTLAENCYANMFGYCSSLTAAPSLPATTLANWCYAYMFMGCASITTPPSLPATSFVNITHSYEGMFMGCTSLTTAPELPATNLSYAWHCYQDMFNGCTSLVQGPSVLPATTLATGCYNGMFKDCTSLTTAPAIMSTEHTTYGCDRMFSGCTSLTYIKCLTIPYRSQMLHEPDYNYYDWVVGVPANGTFVKNPNASLTTDWLRGKDGIPSGWTVQDA